MMVKLVKPNINPAKVGTKVVKEHNSFVKKTAGKYPQKRMLMLRRRISALLDEKESLEAKNLELTDGFNKEKKLTSELQKQVFNWQRLYHEAVMSLNSYKVKTADMVQTMSTGLKDMNVSLSHLLGVSEFICHHKVRLTSLLNSLRTVENENSLPRAFGDNGQMNTSMSKEREKRMKQKVGPMVKGVLIQKPTIRLERVMLHQPHDQEPANSDLTPPRTNALTPITEENEQDTSLRLSQISMRRRKHRLGSGDRWRKRKQEQLEKERQMERERERENQCSLVAEESSDSDNHIGPCMIRLQRLSGLLLSPQLLDVDRGRASEGKKATSRSSEPDNRRLRGGEDPMEGCSWMNINSMHSSNKKKAEKEKLQSPATSESSDEESDTINVVVQKNVPNNVADSMYKSQTFNNCRKDSSSSLADTSQEASDSSRHEPDSTSNIVFSRDSPTRNSLGTNSSIASAESARKQLAFSDATSGVSRSQQIQESVSDSLPSDTAPQPQAKDSARSSQDRKRSSGFCNNCTPFTSPDRLEKRVRKPKIHLYPGEESNNPKATVPKVKKTKQSMKTTSKVTINRLSVGRKSLGKSSLKKSLEESSVPVSATADRLSNLGRPTGSSQKKNAPKSSLKKSIETPRNSVTTLDQSRSRDEERRSRRNKRPMSYKESPLNVKMRRPK